MSRLRGRWRTAAVIMVLAQVLLAAPAGAVECWHGWGYWVDARTRTYKSDELLLVTRGPATWSAGQPVEIYLLDRATGRIAASTALTLIPIDPRVYYRGRSNYVSGTGDVAGHSDRLVFGLQHLAPPAAANKWLDDYNAWACGLGEAPG